MGENDVAVGAVDVRSAVICICCRMLSCLGCLSVVALSSVLVAVVVGAVIFAAAVVNAVTAKTVNEGAGVWHEGCFV